MLKELYELVTRRPWTTVRSATAEFGPPPGAVYRDELSQFSDVELYARGDQIMTALAVRHRQPRRSASRVA
jgi:hypothetical protein